MEQGLEVGGHHYLLILLLEMQDWELVHLVERLRGLLNLVQMGMEGIYWFSQRSVGPLLPLLLLLLPLHSDPLLPLHPSSCAETRNQKTGLISRKIQISI